MFELNGKYNNCKVFTDNVDNETISQLTQLLNQEYVGGSQIRIMPDTHAGTGCVIGTTMTLTDKVCPNLVGVDIGCGMYAVRLKETDIEFEKLDEVIMQKIPSGFDIHEKPVAVSNADKIYAPVDADKAMKSLGTLGGGNHFIEIDRDDEGKLWLVVHTGSRHLGIEVCKHYQDLAYRSIKEDGVKEKIEEAVKNLKALGREKEIEETIKEIRKQESKIPKDLCYVTGKAFDDYIHDMSLAQEHAKINRKTIADIIMQEMNLHCDLSFDTIHNYIDTQDMILRKGSISAKEGEMVIIPMNMRDGSLICIGKGNRDWNYSAPHGAGRIMSRGQAKENINLSDFKETMKGIYTTCVCESTIDESPFAYKPMQEIVENIKDTVSIQTVIRPVYNFKAH